VWNFWHSGASGGQNITWKRDKRCPVYPITSGRLLRGFFACDCVRCPSAIGHRPPACDGRGDGDRHLSEMQKFCILLFFKVRQFIAECDCRQDYQTDHGRAILKVQAFCDRQIMEE
jgi:hypothetical protein